MRSILLPIVAAMLASCAPAPSVEPQVPLARIPDMRIIGQATYRERIGLQRGSAFEVSLIDISRSDAAAPVIARNSRTISGEQVPLPFEIVVKQHRLKTNLRYAVRATIRRPDGMLAWTTDKVYLVDPTLEHQDLGALLLVRVNR